MKGFKISNIQKETVDMVWDSGVWIWMNDGLSIHWVQVFGLEKKKLSELFDAHLDDEDLSAEKMLDVIRQAGGYVKKPRENLGWLLPDIREGEENEEKYEDEEYDCQLRDVAAAALEEMRDIADELGDTILTEDIEKALRLVFDIPNIDWGKSKEAGRFVMNDRQKQKAATM